MLARTTGGHSHRLSPFTYLFWNTEGVPMNRLLAKILLLLLILSLLFSMYLFYQGRFMEGLYIYPLMITIYVVMFLSGKRKG